MSSEEEWRGFLEWCRKMRSTEELNQFFQVFLTFEERETLASRYAIVKGLLEEQLTQREMAEEYQVSIAQITRGSNALKIIDPKLKQYLKKLLSHKKSKKDED
ncbi:trp operon repressor [Parachlamydia sp. C2]|uniref:trp operon repressor n=1 Tax=Candidatus Protochlamydia phocaeensis TaxID=1414722 RepID=UPI0008397654